MFAELIGLAGPIGGALMSYFGQKEANQANAQMNDKQMEWQERMSNSAVSRAANDMQNAGLNKILAVPNGASTPSPNATPQQNTMEGFANTGMEIANLVRQKRVDDSTLQVNDANAELLKQQKSKATQETLNLMSQRLKTHAETQAIMKELPMSEGKNMLWNHVKELAGQAKDIYNNKSSDMKPVLKGPVLNPAKNHERPKPRPKSAKELEFEKYWQQRGGQ